MYFIKDLRDFCIQKGLKFVHQNIRGLQINFNSLCTFIECHQNLDVITLSETHTSFNENSDLYKIDGYDFILRSRANGKGGGVCIYLKNNINWERRYELESDNIENIWVEIFLPNAHSFLICCFYRPPNSSKYLSETFIETFNKILQNVSKEVILLGDCNANYADKTNNKDFKSMLQLNGFEQLIDKPTRITDGSSSIIDIIATNKNNIKHTKVISTSFSDHEMVCCLRKINHRKFPPREIKCRNFSNYNRDELNSDIKNANWDVIYNISNVNKAVEYFNNILETAFNKHAPMINKNVKGRPCPWLNSEIKNKMNLRDKFLRKYRKTRKDKDRQNYKTLRNKCTNLFRKAKSSYYTKKLHENDLSPKKFWKTIKNVFPSKSKGEIPKTKNKYELAKKFSNWFSTVIDTLKRKTMPLKDLVWNMPLVTEQKTNKSFVFQYVSVIFVAKQLKTLKRSKASGLDNLPPSLLKDTINVIAKPLTYIINLSLRSGTMPNCWKKARVVPIHKNGPTTDVENYRPISILPAVSKIIEKAVHEQFSTFIEENDLLSKSQFGFRKRRSTDAAVTLCCDTIRKAAGEGKLTGAVFLDLTRAFDTINHSTLITKLSTYGVSDKELDWFQSYLFQRTQTIDINATFSEEKPIFTGVPQGTILGPLLFIIFFNDFQQCLKNSNVIQYADDTVISVANKDVNIINKLLNEDLEQISNYCFDNELMLNLKEGKTTRILIVNIKRQHSV